LTEFFNSLSSILQELAVYLYFDSIWQFVKTVVDIAIVEFIIYKLLGLLRETRAWQLMKGVLVLVFAMLVSRWLGFTTISYLLDNTFQYIAIAFLIIFQPELRRALEKLGTNSISNLLTSEDNNEILVSSVIEAIVNAAETLSSSRTGALIVIEGQTKLGEIMDDCIELDSKVSSGLLINIFEPNTPLHDGAVIIRDNRVKAAACYLPHSKSTMIPKELGTRHRAAIGVSEVSDAMAIIVSEETGHISIAQGGNLHRGLTADLLRNKLRRQLEITGGVDKEKKKGFISRWAKSFNKIEGIFKKGKDSEQ